MHYPASPKIRSLAVLMAAGALLSLTDAPPTAAQAAVLTQDNDNARTGANTSEMALTPATVSGGNFGKLFTIGGLNANVNGQVLYVPTLSVRGATHNVLYAYTSNNTDNSPCGLYAFDADTGAQLWTDTLPNSATYTTATPVIDPKASIIYVLTKTGNDDTGLTYLHAFDLATGAEKPGSPVHVQASAPGTGDGSVGGLVYFDGDHGNGRFHANDRAGLLLLNGVVYAGFAHNSDSNPYHGWILGYGYDGTQFTQKYVFCTTPNGSASTTPGGADGGVWQAGKGLTADAQGNIYFSVGNGTFDADTGGIDYGMCYLKLSPSLQVEDYFAPFDEQTQSSRDLDLGNSGLVGIPGTTLMFGGATKFGTGFLLNSTNLGQFRKGPNGTDKIVLRLDGLSPNDSVGQNPIAWDTGSGLAKYVYLWPGGANLEQFLYDPSKGTFNPGGIAKQTSGLTGGGSLAISANGGSGGILWAVDNGAVLRAFNATDVSKPELWDSGQNSGRDALGSVGHFQFPTVVNGKVYVPNGKSGIAVYGLLTGSGTGGVQWQMGDSAIGHVIGRSDTGGWSASTNQDPAGFLQYGPYTVRVPAGNRVASWQLMVDNNTFAGDGGPVVELQAYDTTRDVLLGARDVQRREFTGTFQYQTFALPFALPAADAGDRLELRVFWFRRSYVREGSVAINAYTWQMGDSAIGHVIGRSDTGGWSASTNQDPAGFLQYGPYITQAVPGSQTALWQLMVDNNTFAGDGGPVVELQAYDTTRDVLLGARDVQRREFTGTFQYQTFALPFALPAADAGDRLELRVFWFRKSYIRERDVSLGGNAATP